MNKIIIPVLASILVAIVMGLSTITPTFANGPPTVNENTFPISLCGGTILTGKEIIHTTTVDADTELVFLTVSSKIKDEDGKIVGQATLRFTSFINTGEIRSFDNVISRGHCLDGSFDNLFISIEIINSNGEVLVSIIHRK